MVVIYSLLSGRAFECTCKRCSHQRCLFCCPHQMKSLGLFQGYRAFAEASDGSMCLAMEYGGEKSLNDLIEERNDKNLGPFPAATILQVALNMARGLKVGP